MDEEVHIRPHRPALRPTDFLPRSYNGEKLDYDLCYAHYLSFFDYLVAQALYNPDEAGLPDMLRINTLFKSTLHGQARLWAEGLVFENLEDLKARFLQRFSPSHSQYSNVRSFNTILYTPGDTAQQTLNKLRLAAQRIGYDERQIRDRFMQILPQDCLASVIMSAPPDADVNILAEKAQQYFDFAPKYQSGTDPKQVTFQGDAVHVIQSPHNAPSSAPTSCVLDPIAQLTSQVAHLCSEVKQMKLDKALDAVNSAQQHVPRPMSPHPKGEHQARSRGSNERRPRGDRRSNSADENRYRNQSRSPYRNQGHHKSGKPPAYYCWCCNKANHKWRDCYTYKNMLKQGMNPSYFPVRPPAPGPQMPFSSMPSQPYQGYSQPPSQTYPFRQNFAQPEQGYGQSGHSGYQNASGYQNGPDSRSQSYNKDF